MDAGMYDIAAGDYADGDDDDGGGGGCDDESCSVIGWMQIVYERHCGRDEP